MVLVADSGVEKLSAGNYVVCHHSLLSMHDSTGRMLRKTEVEFGRILKMEEITLNGNPCLAVHTRGL